MERGISVVLSEFDSRSNYPHRGFSIADDREIAGRIWTVGHSTHQLGRLVELLQRHSIELLVDVRTVPKSRRMPWFWGEALAQSLPEAGIAYEHMRELGGFRRPRPGSPNGAWRVAAFQGYADNMESPEWRSALALLQELAGERRTTIMCAEAQWTRCHRRLISDALVVRGWAVCHILSSGSAERHELTPFAVVDGLRITYPPEQTALEL